MPNKIKPKRSYTTSAVPTAAELEVNELAINWADGIAYTKDASGQIVSLTMGGGGGSSVDSRWNLFLPPAPTGLAGTGSDGQVALSWTAPTGVLAQTPVTDYIVQFSSDGGTNWATFADGTSTDTTATVTGLTNDTEYRFRVAAVNGVGTGSFSDSTAVTPGAAATDPDFANVVLLLHMDGANGSTTFTDSSSYGRTATVYRNAALSDTQSKFGGTSGYFSGGSTGSGTSQTADAITFPDSADFNMGSSDWTIDAWVYVTSFATNQEVWAHRDADNFGTAILSYLRINTNGTVRMYHLDNSGPGLVTDVTTSETLSSATWHHLAVVRSSGSVAIYIDGTAATLTGTNNTNSYGDCPGGISIGAGADGAGTNGWSSRFTGYIDEFRWTIGTARYTANFTPPTAAFPDSGPSTGINVQYLVIAGGGGGASDLGGGGGAGGYRTSYGTSGQNSSAEGALQLLPGTSYTVTVGAGGAGGINQAPSASAPAVAGSNSVFSTVESTGGGPGDSVSSAGGSGGSGGGGGGRSGSGGGGSGTSNQGFDGGGGSALAGNDTGSGGGGGAGGSGATGQTGVGGNGGPGIASTITGSSVTRAGGGGGGADDRTGSPTAGSGGAGGGGNGCSTTACAATSGSANSGGGGGGSATGAQNSGGNGGSGVVIIRAPQAASSTTGSPTVTTDGGDTIYTFTGSGSITF